MKSLGLILGSQGMLGSDIVEFFKLSDLLFLAPPSFELDITNKKQIIQFFRTYSPTWVINCVAKHDLIECNKNIKQAQIINRDAVANLAQISAMFNAYFVHISTDYVFDGLKGSPYIEDDIANPVNVYGKTKLEGEKLSVQLNPKSCIVRVAALFGRNISRDKKSYSFVDRVSSKLLAGEKVFVNNQQTISPTSTKEVAIQLKKLLLDKPEGIFHCVNNGFTSWFNLTIEVAKFLNVPISRIMVAENEFLAGNEVARPLNSSLVNKRLIDLDINLMKNWDVALGDYLSKK